MHLKIITINNRTDMTDGRGNTIATLYGLESINHDGKIPVVRLSNDVKAKIEETVSAASGTVTKPTARSRKRGSK